MFLCRYFVPVEVSDEEEEDEEASPDEQEEDFQCVVYFWEVSGSWLKLVLVKQGCKL